MINQYTYESCTLWHSIVYVLNRTKISITSVTVVTVVTAQFVLWLLYDFACYHGDWISTMALLCLPSEKFVYLPRCYYWLTKPEGTNSELFSAKNIFIKFNSFFPQGFANLNNQIDRQIAQSQHIFFSWILWKDLIKTNFSNSFMCNF